MRQEEHPSSTPSSVRRSTERARRESKRPGGRLVEPGTTDDICGPHRGHPRLDPRATPGNCLQRRIAQQLAGITVLSTGTADEHDRRRASELSRHEVAVALGLPGASADRGGGGGVRVSRVTEIRGKVDVSRFRSVSEEAEDTLGEQQSVDGISRVQIGENRGLMSESAKRGGEPREGVRGRGRKRRGDWRTKHLRACLLCGRVWRPRRRRTCPTCHVDRSICLTCDRVAVEDRARRCATDEALRRLVKVCAGDWEWARRALDAAGGDIPRALARAERRSCSQATAGSDSVGADSDVG